MSGLLHRTTFYRTKIRSVRVPIEAVYRSEVYKLAAAEQHFAATKPPLDTLRSWMLLFIDHVSSKRFIMPAVDTVAGGSMRVIESSRSLTHTVFFSVAPARLESKKRYSHD